MTSPLLPDMATLAAQSAQEDHAGTDALERSRNVVVTNEWEAQDAGELLVQVQSRLKLIEDERKKITGPMNAALKQINALFKAPQAKWQQAKLALQSALSAYAYAQDQARQQALAAAQQHAQQGQTDLYYQQAAAADAHAVPQVANVSTRVAWEYEVEDLGRVPIQFLQVNDKAVKAFLIENPDSAEIPGLRVSQVTKFVARSK